MIDGAGDRAATDNDAAVSLLDTKTQQRLADYLREAAGGKVTIDRLRRLMGGAIQENWLIDVTVDGGPLAGEQALVLRTSPPRGMAESHPPEREFALLKAARGAGVTVPEPLWACDDAAVIGNPFFIMRRISGVSLGQKIVRGPFLASARDALARRLGGELARIHTIRPGHPELEFLTVPVPDPASAAIAAYRAYLDGHHAPHPVLEWGLRWAELNAPPAAELVLCHRDYRTGNYMVDVQGPENGGLEKDGLTGILDWEFAGWGAPMEDIAWFCAKCWRFGANEKEAGGISTRDRFYAGYRVASGREIDPVAVVFWEVMAHVRWALIAMQQAERYYAGAEPALELAAIGRRPAEMELEILILTGVTSETR